MRELIEEVELADELGLDVFGVGEHHRPDFARLRRRRSCSPPPPSAPSASGCRARSPSSAPTTRSASSSSSPTVDLLSGGRAEIMAGRGSFTESFPLFGHDLDDYDDLFAEKLDLLLTIRDDHEHVTWSGRHRAAARGRRRLPAAGPGPAAGLGRRRRLAAVGRPRRRARPAADDRDHRRRSPSASCRSSSSTARRASARGPRPGGAEGRDQHARVRRRDVRRRGRRVRAALPGDDEPHRPRARLAAVGQARSTRRCARRAARSPSARPSRSPRRSCSSTSCSATSATWRR